MQLLRLPETLTKTGLSRTRLYVLVARNEFPQPVKLGPGPQSRAIAFSAEEVDGWISERLAERSAA